MAEQQRPMGRSSRGLGGEGLAVAPGGAGERVPRLRGAVGGLDLPGRILGLLAAPRAGPYRRRPGDAVAGDAIPVGASARLGRADGDGADGSRLRPARHGDHLDGHRPGADVAVGGGAAVCRRCGISSIWWPGSGALALVLVHLVLAFLRRRLAARADRPLGEAMALFLKRSLWQLGGVSAALLAVALVWPRAEYRSDVPDDYTPASVGAGLPGVRRQPVRADLRAHRRPAPSCPPICSPTRLRAARAAVTKRSWPSGNRRPIASRP